jgi:hypothetical protein
VRPCIPALPGTARYCSGYHGTFALRDGGTAQRCPAGFLDCRAAPPQVVDFPGLARVHGGDGRGGLVWQVVLEQGEALKKPVVPRALPAGLQAVRWSVQPALPRGLSIDRLSGALADDGSWRGRQPFRVTISASTGGGSARSTLDFKVVKVVPVRPGSGATFGSPRALHAEDCAGCIGMPGPCEDILPNGIKLCAPGDTGGTTAGGCGMLRAQGYTRCVAAATAAPGTAEAAHAAQPVEPPQAECLVGAW